MKTHDLKGDALLELGTRMDGPHHFGQWVKHFYHHWQKVLKLDVRDSLEDFEAWLEEELHRTPLDPAIEEILQKIGDGKAKVKPFDKTKCNLNEIQRFLAGVKYITKEADRIKYRVRFQGGSVYRRGSLFDTADLSTVFSGLTWAIWVRSPIGDFYSHSHKLGIFHHSSFLAGGVVLAAGEWQVVQGRVTTISGKSGHYQPGMQSLWQSVQFLAQCGVMQSDAKVLLYERPKKKRVEWPYQTFLSMAWQQVLFRCVVDQFSNEEPKKLPQTTVAAASGPPNQPLPPPPVTAASRPPNRPLPLVPGAGPYGKLNNPLPPPPVTAASSPDHYE